MKSVQPGRSTSVVEVTHISQHGFWLLLPKGEVFLAFDAFPWFREATIGQIQKVQLLHSDHLYWPDLEVDLSLESIDHPERFPLVSGATRGVPRRPAGAGRVSEGSRIRRRAGRA